MWRLRFWEHFSGMAKLVASEDEDPWNSDNVIQCTQAQNLGVLTEHFSL